MSVEERLNEVETRLTFQDDAIQSLSDLVYVQQRQLDRLQQICDLLNQRLNEAAGDTPVKVIDEPPPHY